MSRNQESRELSCLDGVNFLNFLEATNRCYVNGSLDLDISKSKTQRLDPTWTPFSCRPSRMARETLICLLSSVAHAEEDSDVFSHRSILTGWLRQHWQPHALQFWAKIGSTCVSIYHTSLGTIFAIRFLILQFTYRRVLYLTPMDC